METRMPRGAIPIARSELAAAEPYIPESGAEPFIPSGEFPTPNHELAAARPYRPGGDAPESFLAWPVEIGTWRDDTTNDSIWAEEAFAKACATPNVFVSADLVLRAAEQCASSNFAEFMQMRGFEMDGAAYLDGPFRTVNWTNSAVLNAAIANAGPVKIGIAAADLASHPHGQVTPGMSGWAIYGLPAGNPENYCASICGYGPRATLVELIKKHGVNVDLPPGMPGGLCYATFIRNSIGIVDQQSLMNITGEAWSRTPTTIIKKLNR